MWTSITHNSRISNFFLPIIYMGGYLIWHWTRSSVSDDARDPPWGNVWNRENRSCRPANGVINVCLLSLEQYFNNTQNKYSICTIAWIWNTCTKNNTIVSFMFLFFIQQSTWFNKQTTMVSNTWQLKHNYTNIAHVWWTNQQDEEANFNMHQKLLKAMMMELYKYRLCLVN